MLLNDRIAEKSGFLQFRKLISRQSLPLLGLRLLHLIPRHLNASVDTYQFSKANQLKIKLDAHLTDLSMRIMHKSRNTLI